tara:strand:+ start:7311 stop:7586 length:276 start_codon:yes stop_codon:yes gene_type:complete
MSATSSNELVTTASKTGCSALQVSPSGGGFTPAKKRSWGCSSNADARWGVDVSVGSPTFLRGKNSLMLTHFVGVTRIHDALQKNWAAETMP